MARSKDFDESEVLSKAVNLFWQKGYNGTSMQDLVDNLNISRSSLYDTYVDKRTLYLKALTFYNDTAITKMEELQASSASTKSTIKKMLEMIAAELLSDKEQKGCFMVNAEVEVAPDDAEVRSIVCQNEKKIENLFLQAIKKGQKAGEVSKSQDALALARFFLNTVKGIRVSAKSTTDKSIFQDIIKTSLSVLD